MMDFGYLGSSSNLSPLARPFNLDHSIPMPKTETIVNFTDPPPVAPFSSSLPSWQYSLPSASNPNFYSDSGADLGVDSIQTSYPTSENYYPYFEVPSISSPTTQRPPSSANVRTTPDTFAYPQYLGKIPTTPIASETYGPSFVPPVVEDDVPLMALRKTGYDLSSASFITPLDGSSQVDYHQSLSGLKYKPQCGSYWDGIDRLAGDEMGKLVEYDGSFCSRRTEGAGSYVYKSYMKQGPSTTEGFNTGKECSAGTPGTHLNLLQGESSFVTPFTGELINKPFSTPGSSFTPYNPARTLGTSPFPKSHAHVPPVEATTTFLNHQKTCTLQDQSFQPLNAGKIGSVTIKRPSPPVVIRPPSVGSNLRLGGKEHFSDSNSSNIKGELPNKPLVEDVKGHMSKAEMELQLPNVSAPYCFISASDKTNSVASVEGPLESIDRYYPALDSPCWKGASSFRFSPSEEHGAVTSEHLVKKPESLGALKLQQTQFCTLSGEDNANISCQKAHENSICPENGYVELGSLLCPDRLPNASSPVKVDNSTHDDGIDHAKMSVLDPFSNEIEKLTKELDSPGDSKSFLDLGLSQSKHPDSGKYELGREAEAELNCNDAALKLDVQKLVEIIHNLSELLLFQCSDNASALSEVGHGTLKHAMKNLDACISKIVSKPAQESNLHKSVISGRPQVTEEVSSPLGYCNHTPEQGTKINELSEKEVKMFTDLFSTRVDEDFEKDNKVIQAIRKVLEENFSVKEEMQSETLLYKNLWLEAEAALCCVSFRARYDRMKTDMDKYKSPKPIEPMKTFEELYSEVFQGNPMNGSFKMSHKSTQDPSASGTTEAETSFRARLNILNNRSLNYSSVYAEEETNEEADAAFAETIKNVEKLLSFDDAEDCAMTDLTPKVPPHAISSKVPSKLGNNTISSKVPSKPGDNAISSKVPSKPGDNVDASVMARFQILKDRGANAICKKSGQQSELVVSSEHSGQRNPWRFGAVLYEEDNVDWPLSQDCKVSEQEMVKDFHVCASGDVADQLSGNISLGTQPSSSGWCDGSLSDWEDVLKDEFACKK